MTAEIAIPEHALAPANLSAEVFEQMMDDATKKGFAEAYPGDALDNLWWYPSEPTYFVSTRKEYKEKYLAAFTD